MTGLDEQEAVAAQEMGRHRHLPAIGQHAGGVLGEFLDEAEDVVPAPAIEPSRVIPELVDDLVHFESRHDRFDQNGRADRALRYAEPLLRIAEHVVPQPGLEMALELRQIKVRCGAARHQLARIVEKEQCEIEERPGHRRPVD